MYQAIYHSPIGKIRIKATEDELMEVVFSEEEAVCLDKNHIIENCIAQLQEYFNKQRESFNLPLKIEGTSFQKEVWDTISRISYGKTASYKDVALQMDNLGAIRAIGKANGDNKFHIIIPCHRVIGSDGSLTGYAGGLDVKKQLLLHEGSIKANQLSFSFSK